MDSALLLDSDGQGAGLLLLVQERVQQIEHGFQGPGGREGSGFSVAGTVNTYADLPTGLTADDQGTGYLVAADSLLYVWDGAAYPADGAGVPILEVQGPAGPANSLVIGTVTTLAAGSQATAEITGTPPSQTLDLGLPQGAKGDPGTGGTGGIASVQAGTGVAVDVTDPSNPVVGVNATTQASLAKADSAVQPGTTLAHYGITDAATSAQGAKADTALQPALEGAANGLATLGSDGKLASSQIPASLLGQVDYQGTWDASAGTAPSASPGKGQYWIVNVAGTTSVGGITDWQVGDWIIYGTTWTKVDNTDAVVSVAGLTGAISGASLFAAMGLGTAATHAATDFEPAISGGTTAQYWRGDKGWRDFATDVRAAVLTGLSTATNATITAADTVLAALGKLQAQISANAAALAGKAGTAVANVFTQQQAVTPYRANISGAVSIDLAGTAKSNTLILTLTGNVTSFALTNPVDGASYSISFVQDATGGHTMPALPAAMKFSGGTAPTWTTTANARDKLCLDYDATAGIYECAFAPGMS